jgi:hypothetical protein
MLIMLGLYFAQDGLQSGTLVFAQLLLASWSLLFLQSQSHCESEKTFSKLRK